MKRAVWAAWEDLPEDCESPVKTIANRLGFDPVDVAPIVFPPEPSSRPYYWWLEPDPIEEEGQQA